MNAIHKAAVSTKKFVYKHRVAVAVISTTAVCLTIQHYALEQHNAFLKEKGLYEEFYTPEDE